MININPEVYLMSTKSSKNNLSFPLRLFWKNNNKIVFPTIGVDGSGGWGSRCWQHQVYWPWPDLQPGQDWHGWGSCCGEFCERECSSEEKYLVKLFLWELFIAWMWWISLVNMIVLTPLYHGTMNRSAGSAWSIMVSWIKKNSGEDAGACTVTYHSVHIHHRGQVLLLMPRMIAENRYYWKMFTVSKGSDSSRMANFWWVSRLTYDSLLLWQTLWIKLHLKWV